MMGDLRYLNLAQSTRTIR